MVMDDGRILTEGTPEQVFSQVELLRAHALDVPQATELVYELKKAGVPLKGNALDEKECAAMLHGLFYSGE